MHLAFDVATYGQRIERVRAALAQAELDGLVVMLPDSINWLTGFDTIGYLWPQALLVDRSGDEPVLHTRTTEEPGFRETSWLTDGVFYDIALERPMEVLARSITGRGLSRIGVDLQAFTLVPAAWEELKRLLPDAEFVDGSAIVPELRLVKSAAELAYQRQAAEIVDEAMSATIAAVRPGVSEIQLAGIASAALGAAGSEFPAIPPMVVSGHRSSLVHAMPSRRMLGRGDVVCLELGAAVERYHAIVMRTVVIGRPTPRVAEVAACLAEAHEAAIAASVAGAPAHAPDDACNAVLERLDLVRRRCHRIGYSIGIAYPPGWLEPMTLVAGDEHVLAPGMSFSIEPNISLRDEGFGLKLGETVACAADGPVSLTNHPHELVVLGRSDA